MAAMFCDRQRNYLNGLASITTIVQFKDDAVRLVHKNLSQADLRNVARATRQVHRFESGQHGGMTFAFKGDMMDRPGIGADRLFGLIGKRVARPGDMHDRSALAVPHPGNLVRIEAWHRRPCRKIEHIGEEARGAGHIERLDIDVIE
jgi:hypothetical protein